MAMITKTVETPDARSWTKIIMAAILGTPIIAGLFILATSPENVLAPIGLLGCSGISFGLVVAVFHKLRPKILD